MPKTVLNIGAGFFPLVATDIGAEIVINYDPLQFHKAKGDITSKTYDDAEKYFKTVIRFKEIIAKSDEIMYETDRDKLDQLIPDSTVDLVISISPYGFTLIDEWVDAKLRIYGNILVAANSKNKWAEQDSNLYSSNKIKDRYQEKTNLPGTRLSAWRLAILKKYQSNTTKIEKETELDMFRLLQKIV